ncbi:MAG: hypothetical protein ACJ8BW_18350, partial [Ktedonobacteraceae bacterium]
LEESPLFQRFRGTEWMPEPCRSCKRREVDFGGCRCQAFQLTGDAARTDPVCHLSPDHRVVADAVEAANAGMEPVAPGRLVPRASTARRVETMAVHLPARKSHQFSHRYDVCQDDKNSDYYSPTDSLESPGDVP